MKRLQYKSIEKKKKKSECKNKHKAVKYIYIKKLIGRY
jgi:hypothetical protein